jgi:recombinational DNA repair ATPase RecF
MLTKLTIRNFKRFHDVEIPLTNTVVFVGPNNSGKTTALQALALWEIGLRRWKERRSDRETPEKRPGVTINRRDLYMVPAPSTLQLWRGTKYQRCHQQFRRKAEATGLPHRDCCGWS